MRDVFWGSYAAFAALWAYMLLLVGAAGRGDGHWAQAVFAISGAAVCGYCARWGWGVACR